MFNHRLTNMKIVKHFRYLLNSSNIGSEFHYEYEDIYYEKHWI